MKLSTCAKLSAACAFMSAAAANAQDNVKLSISTPVYVKHLNEWPSKAGQWNEGVLNNPGIVLDIDFKVTDLDENTSISAGPTLGFYKNSFCRQTELYGANVMVNREIGQGLNLYAGAQFGAVTGYGKTKPAMAPFAGIEKEIFKKVSVGARVEWLPADTLPTLLGMNAKRKSDVLNGLATLSFRL